MCVEQDQSLLGLHGGTVESMEVIDMYRLINRTFVGSWTRLSGWVWMRRIIAAALLGSLGGPVLAADLMVAAENFPPFSYYEDGKVTGFAIEVLEQVIDGAELTMQEPVRIWPWARMVKTIETTANFLIPCMSRSAKRDALFKWVGPINPREIWLFKLKGRSEIVIDTLEEAKAYKVGSQIGSNATQQLLDTGFTRGQNLNLVSDETQNLQMLLRGRVDLVSFNLAEMAYRLKQLSPPISMDNVEKTYLLSDEYQYYIALSKEVPDSTIAKMQAVLDAMKADGRYDAIWKKYME